MHDKYSTKNIVFINTCFYFWLCSRHEIKHFDVCQVQPNKWLS